MKENNSRWIKVGLGTVVMLVLGLIYAWSIFAQPLEQEFGWTRDQTSLVFTISIVFFVVGLLVTGFASKRIAHRWLMLLAGVLLFVGFIACSYITKLSQLYLFYGVGIGLAVGIANNALVSSIVAWFPDKKGLASGILMMGFGLGGFLLSGMTERLLRQYGFRKVFLYFGIVFGIVVILGSFLTTRPTATQAAVGAKKTQDSNELKNYPLTQVLRLASYWLYIVWFSLVMAGGLLIIGHASPFAQQIGLGTSAAAMAAGLLSLSNGVGRVFTGVIADRYGLEKTMRLNTILLIFSALLLIAATLVNSTVLLVAGYLFTGLFYGGGPTTSSLYASSKYGTSHFAENYAAVSAGMIPGALGPYLAGVLARSTGGYLASFLCMLGFGIVAFVVLKPMQKQQ